MSIRKVFVMFMGRDGDSEQMSSEEFLRLRETIKLDACPKAHLRMQRTGSRFALDRRKRMEIVEIYHKAGEHAYYGYCKANGINPLRLDNQQVGGYKRRHLPRIRVRPLPPVKETP